MWLHGVFEKNMKERNLKKKTNKQLCYKFHRAGKQSTLKFVRSCKQIFQHSDKVTRLSKTVRMHSYAVLSFHSMKTNLRICKDVVDGNRLKLEKNGKFFRVSSCM